MWMSHPGVTGVVTVADSAFFGGWDTVGWVAAVAPAGPPLVDAGWPISRGELDAAVGASVAAAGITSAGVDTKITAALAPLPATYARTFNPLAYGAVGNGIADDTSAVQAAITAARAVAGSVFIPAGTYLVDGLLTYGGVTIYGVGDSSVLKHTATGSNYVLSVNPGSGGTPDPATNEARIRVSDLAIQGRTTGLLEAYLLFNFNAVTDVTVERCTFTGWKGDAIYFGAGNTAGIERHNLRLRVRDCIFDGVNNNNRNAVTVIDGDGVWIKDNYFTNIATATMPGGVLVEPNSPTFSIVRNMWISDNKFRNVTGGIANISISLHPQEALAVPACGFWISDNTFDLPAGATAFRANVTDITHAATDATTTTVPHNINVRGNQIRGGSRPFQFFGIRGLKLGGNTYDGCTSSALLGNLSLGAVVDVTIQDDIFRSCASDPAQNGSALVLFKGTRIKIKSNVFDNCGHSDGTAGNAVQLAVNGITDTISIRDNDIFGALTKASVSIGSAHITTPATNDFTDNRDASANGCDINFGAPWNDTAYPRTVDYDSTVTSNTIGVAGDARIMRSKGEGLVTKIGVLVGTSSGNICVGVYQQNGLRGKASRPATLIGTSGSVACPAAGYAEIVLLAPVHVRKGDYLAIGCDNGTASFTQASIGSGASSPMWDACVYQMSPGVPLPVTPTALLAQNNRVVALCGVR